MQRKINLTHVICLRMRKTIKAKPHRLNLRSLLPRIYYYQNKQLQVKGIPVPNTNLQLNPYPNTQLDLWCSGNLSIQSTTPSSLRLTKSTTQMCSTAYRDQNPRNSSQTTAAHASTHRHKLQLSSQVPPRILNSLIGFWSHAPPCRPCCSPIYKNLRIWPSSNPTSALICHLEVLHALSPSYSCHVPKNYAIFL